MARPRTPTNVLEMRGSFKKNPQRRKERAAEPKDLPLLGKCPEHLGPLVKEAWEFIASRCPWLQQPDEVALERAAVQLAALRIGDDGADEKAFQGYIRMLGIPATERSKVRAPKVEPANPFQEVG